MSSGTNKIYYGIDKDGIKRVWGVTREDCELARKEYLAEKPKWCRYLWKHISIIEEEIDE